MQDLPEWTQSAKRVDALEPEIAFLLKADFYTGDPNDFAQFDDPRYSEALDLPSIPRVRPERVSTREALGREGELAAYYRRVVERSRGLGRPFDGIRHYFWLRMALSDIASSEEGEEVISFPWYDTLSECEGFIGWLEASGEEAFDDQDQGWRLEAVVADGLVYLRQSDPDADTGDEEVACVMLPLEPLLRALVEERELARAIVASLARALGADVWTRWVPGEPAFGTADWRP